MVSTIHETYAKHIHHKLNISMAVSYTVVLIQIERELCLDISPRVV